MEIETKRLILRELTTKDFSALFEIVSDPETMQHYPKPFDKEKTKKWIEWNLQNYKKYGFGLWAVVLKETGEFIGDCGITIQNIDGEIGPVRPVLYIVRIAHDFTVSCHKFSAYYPLASQNDILKKEGNSIYYSYKCCFFLFICRHQLKSDRQSSPANIKCFFRLGQTKNNFFVHTLKAEGCVARVYNAVIINLLQSSLSCTPCRRAWFVSKASFPQARTRML